MLEASKALAFSLRGDLTRGSVHFDRAVAASRAIGHKLHEGWIERFKEEDNSRGKQAYRLSALGRRNLQREVTRLRRLTQLADLRVARTAL